MYNKYIYIYIYLYITRFQDPASTDGGTHPWRVRLPAKRGVIWGDQNRPEGAFAPNQSMFLKKGAVWGDQNPQRERSHLNRACF